MSKPKQESIPVGCVPPAFVLPGVGMVQGGATVPGVAVGGGGTVPGGTVRGDIVGRHYLSPAPMWRDNMCKTLPSRNFVCGG